MYGIPVGTINVAASQTGVQLITPSPQQSPSVRIFNIHIIADSSGSTVTITNGSGGTTIFSLKATASTGTTFDFGINGHTFPLGAFITTDSHCTNAAIACRLDQF